VTARHVDLPLDGVEDEELGLGTEVRRVAETGGLEVGLRALGERSRIALVALAVRRLDDVARDEERRLVHERIDVRRARVRHQQHVGRLDALPPRDRGAVERVPRVELVLGELLRGHGDVLLLAAGVGEAEVDELDLLVLDHLEHVGGCCHAGLLLLVLTDRRLRGLKRRRMNLGMEVRAPEFSEKRAYTKTAPDQRLTTFSGRAVRWRAPIVH
jgi:hypothetical protein